MYCSIPPPPCADDSWRPPPVLMTHAPPPVLMTHARPPSVFATQDELYMNGAVILPHKEIKESVPSPAIIL